MDILYLLIPLAIILLVVIASFFFWSVKSGQMDDLEGPAYRILMDDDDIHVPDEARVAKGQRSSGQKAEADESPASNKGS